MGQTRLIGHNKVKGVGLIELVITITLFSMALVPLLAFFSQQAGRSADPLIRQQASAIAQAYLEETMLNGFCDPDFITTSCPLQCNSSVCGSCGGAIPGAESRSNFDDICDYDGLSDSGARNQFDQLLLGLGQYTVTINVVDSGISLNGLAANSGASARVDVTVSHAGISDVVLSAWKVNL